ncbi:uncharacterized protein K452DRAFT_311349 [Aplosporella prunicola CBS 121167]|uniref:Uncharacterized protein n=1 Tax=Aplosporella prunicola CBS 121167 TaxID=1176127 RepID=A0A6A6B4A9_9PEZI|nr:uncharacterized protein K452DRAFT_311349 [Aplosporella prunicola CBS 121167]KAF2138900.1 hypothetical protein K452DRAFT_311349 [Aplosporella prunicola CBS 121167]
MGLSDDFCPVAAAADLFAPFSFAFIHPPPVDSVTATATACAFGLPFHGTMATRPGAYVQEYFDVNTTNPYPSTSTHPTPAMPTHAVQVHTPTPHTPLHTTPTPAPNARKRKRSLVTTSTTGSSTTNSAASSLNAATPPPPPAHQIPKKRRLHHTLITSRLSRPYAQPATHISGGGGWGREVRRLGRQQHQQRQQQGQQQVWGAGGVAVGAEGVWGEGCAGVSGVSGVSAVEAPLRRAAVLNCAVRRRGVGVGVGVGKGPNAAWAGGCLGSGVGDGCMSGSVNGIGREELVVVDYDALDDEADGEAEPQVEVFGAGAGSGSAEAGDEDEGCRMGRWGGDGEGFVSEYDRLDDGEPEIGILL